MIKKRILIGTVLGPHGVKGDVRVRSFTQEPQALFAFKAVTDESGARSFELKRKGAAKGDFIVAVDGIKDRNAAEALKGLRLFVAREALPKTKKREYYEAELIGLKVADEGGKGLGDVIALHDYGGGPFLEIKPAKGASFMLPFNDTFVPVVDVREGRVTVVVPEGWP